MPKAPPYDEVVAALRAQWALLVAQAEALPTAALDGPTRLGGWSVADLLGHLAGTAERVVGTVAAPCPGEVTLDAVTYWLAPGAPPAADGPGTAGRLAAAVTAAAEALAATSGDRVVRSPRGGMRLVDYARTRVVEAVVHGLDLAAVTAEAVAPDPAAARLATRLLLDVLAAKAPGRSVEVRVPPYGAVQAVAGPRHSRGTPTAVVEIDPLPFLELATGRLDPVAAAADGRLRARGGRSDLSPYLPLLR